MYFPALQPKSIPTHYSQYWQLWLLIALFPVTILLTTPMIVTISSFPNESISNRFQSRRLPPMPVDQIRTVSSHSFMQQANFGYDGVMCGIQKMERNIQIAMGSHGGGVQCKADIARMGLELATIPVMSTEAERIFSGSKLTISDQCHDLAMISLRRLSAGSPGRMRGLGRKLDRWRRCWRIWSNVHWIWSCRGCRTRDVEVSFQSLISFFLPYK